MLLLITTVGLAFVDFGRVINNSIAFIIGFLWLGNMFVLTAADYVTRNHPTGDSPRGEPVFISQHR